VFSQRSGLVETHPVPDVRQDIYTRTLGDFIGLPGCRGIRQGYRVGCVSAGGYVLTLTLSIMDLLGVRGVLPLRPNPNPNLIPNSNPN
jgi:hypothetical protein